ncbi:DUF4240 domain-containing protein [Labilibacter marinus]|uniref:DUF4240 domain-containing protein n=1 Tax=Labilibacter marinus TaxID=1477105 RepID=UPI0009503443|nr:DUF4240 domain-containing protein [Labilibacter marinus]
MNYKFIKSQELGYEKLADMEFEESPRSFADSLKISENEFWELIDDSKRKYPQDFEKQMEFLTTSLSECSNDQIIGFERVLREKVIKLWDYNIKSLYQIIDGKYMSTDMFIYFRFWIISNGNEFYRTALIETDNLSKLLPQEIDIWGEGLMYVADDAFFRKNGKESKLKCPRDLSFDVDYDFGSYKMTGDYINPKNFKEKFPMLTDKY